MKKYLLIIPILILFGCKNNSNTKENNPDNNDSTKVLKYGEQKLFAFSNSTTVEHIGRYDIAFRFFKYGFAATRI